MAHTGGFNASAAEFDLAIEEAQATLKQMSEASGDEGGEVVDQELVEVLTASVAALEAVGSGVLATLPDSSSVTLLRYLVEITDGVPVTVEYALTFMLTIVAHFESLRRSGNLAQYRTIGRAQFDLERLARDRGLNVGGLRSEISKASASKESSRRFSDEAKDEASKEAKTADRLRWLAAGLLASAVVLTAFFAEGESGRGAQSIGTLALSWLIHLGTFLPLFLLVGYLARESAQHRHVSRELKYKSIQMQSASDFAASLGDDLKRSTFLEELGKAMFATNFNQPGRDAQSGLPGDQLNGHIDRLTELVKASQPRR